MLRPFGHTGLQVSALGFGAGHIGGDAMTDAEAGRLLNEVLDAGINLIDTARSYGRSEERIGRFLHHRRAEFVLSTKIGYGIDGHADWTPGLIPAAVDEACRKLQTDYLDIVHFHSCPLDTLTQGGIIEPLLAEVARGRVRVAAYSGDNEPLEWAAASGRFGSVQCSVNMADQYAVARGLAAARQAGLGVIAKRPLANACWRFAERPVGDYAETYWQRWQAMRVDPGPLAWEEVALRFTAFLPGVHSCIVGTGKISHLRRNLEILGQGPLPAALEQSLRAAFTRHGGGWRSET